MTKLWCWTLAWGSLLQDIWYCKELVELTTASGIVSPVLLWWHLLAWWWLLRGGAHRNIARWSYWGKRRQWRCDCCNLSNCQSQHNSQHPPPFDMAVVLWHWSTPHSPAQVGWRDFGKDMHPHCGTSRSRMSTEHHQTSPPPQCIDHYQIRHDRVDMMLMWSAQAQWPVVGDVM